MTFLSTPQRAEHVITAILTDPKASSGVYYHEGGRPLLGSHWCMTPNSKIGSSPKFARYWEQFRAKPA